MVISREQALDRWDTLPDNLREAMFSEVSADILWRACETNHLSEERTQTVAMVAGDVLMGFLHPDPQDVAEEISERARIPKPVGATIAEELYRKIFSPLMRDLVKIYAPLKERAPARSSSQKIEMESEAPAAPVPSFPPERNMPVPENIKVSPSPRALISATIRPKGEDLP